MRCPVLITSLVCVAILASGCGGKDRPKLVQVKGKITLNGAPLEGALIGMMLDPPNEQYKRPAQARTNAQGEFIPASYGDAQGIPTGKYKVTVVKQEFPDDYNAENPEASKSPIKHIVPIAYGNPDTSGLVVEVTASGISPDVIALTGEPEVVKPGAQRRADDP